MNTGSALARFTITLNQAVTEPVQVEWFTSDGTAKAGVDYAANKGTVVFAPGETSKTVDILVYGRAVGSESRSFFVEMLPPTNAILGASIGECIITVDTSGSTPVTQIIVPTGPQGIQGKSAYQSYLDTTTDNPPKTETEWLESLKGDPAEIAEEVAPLIDVGGTSLTAEGTEALSHPDNTTVKAVARRVAYAAPAKIATVTLADGDNAIGQADMAGDTLDFESLGLCPRIMRGTSVITPDWSVRSDGKLVIKGAVAGDQLYVCQYDFISNKKADNRVIEVWRRSLAEAGYNLVQGSFSAGGVLNSDRDVLLDKHEWKAYSGSGPFPQTVSANTNPKVGGFIDKTKVVCGTATVALIATGIHGIGSAITIPERENALFVVVSGGTPNGMDILDAGNGNTAVLQVTASTTIKSIGAKQNDMSVDETAYIQRWIALCKGVIEFGNCTITNLDFKGGFCRQVKLTGNVFVAPTAAEIIWDFASSTQATEIVQIDLNGYTVDCNFKNQLARNSLVKIDYINTLIFENGKVQNIYDRGIAGTWSQYKYLKVDRVVFEEGSLHNGSLDPALAVSSHFIGVFGGEYTEITNSKFRQLTAPVGTQNRNPGGIFISGSNPNKTVRVLDCEFDNLGNLIGGNLVSPLDIYSHSRFVEYARNKFTNSRFIPFRANAAQASIYDNFVLQTNPITYDGGAAYNDAALLAVGIVPRGYDVNKRDNYGYTIRNNVLTVTAAAGNCRAITIASDSTDNVVLNATLEGNTYISVATNSLEAVLIDNILNATIDDAVIEGFTMGYRIQRTDVAGALAATRGHSGRSVYSVKAKSMTNTGTGVYARTNVSNLRITLEGTDLSKTTQPFTFRTAKLARVKDCTMGDTSAGDTLNNGAFYFTGNDSSVCLTDPVSYTTNTYYRLLNNIGRTDRLSA